MKKVSGVESEQRWNFLLKRARLPLLPQGSQEEETDPFDCSDLVIPPTRALVDDVLEEFVQEWKQLDQRKVKVSNSNNNRGKRKRKQEDNEGTSDQHDTTDLVDQDDANTQQEHEEEEKPRTGHRLPTWGWHANRLRMPDKFDYATRKSSPPPKNGGDGERVVSLANPLLQVSYEHELWNLVASVPTVQELEKEATEGAGTLHTQALQQEIAQTLQENTRLDGHALSRLRHSEWHGLPPPFPKNTRKERITTIRMECLRRQLKRGSSPDCHRMELEFRADQTLLDAHKAIVELSQDGLWENEKESADSGLFFIEDTFYTSGAVDYAGPIQKWLSSNPEQTDKVSRAYYLGLSNGPFLTKSMEETQLKDVNVRLGVRYYHVHHGDVECAVFFTDVRLTTDKHASYPIVHDVWSPSHPMAECEACKRLVAVVVSSKGDPLTKGSPTALCRSCVGQLYPTSQEKPTQPYKVYREQVDLSVGHEPTRTLF